MAAYKDQDGPLRFKTDYRGAATLRATIEFKGREFAAILRDSRNFLQLLIASERIIDALKMLSH